MVDSGQSFSDELGMRLAHLQADFTSIKGTSFAHFFCPVLFRDDDVELCKGHVLTQAFGVAAGKWTVQRADIDNFFGSRFESDITKVRYRDALVTENVLGDSRLRRELRPRIYAGSREIEFFIPQGEVPGHFTAMRSKEDGVPPLIGLKIHPSELDEVIDADWYVEVSLDLRVGFFVSLLRAAHLTLFCLHGYRYAPSLSGYLVGSQMLGKLFDAAKELSRGEAQKVAKQQLTDSVNMVRPVIKTELDLKGTILDRQVFVAWSSSGFPWATIVIVPVGDSLHGVMLPVGDHAEGVATWHSFMKNDNDSIAVKLGRFDPETEGGTWFFSKDTWRIEWPKGVSFL